MFSDEVSLVEPKSDVCPCSFCEIETVVVPLLAILPAEAAISATSGVLWIYNNNLNKIKLNEPELEKTSFLVTYLVTYQLTTLPALYYII